MGLDLTDFEFECFLETGQVCIQYGMNLGSLVDDNVVGALLLGWVAKRVRDVVLPQAEKWFDSIKRTGRREDDLRVGEVTLGLLFARHAIDAVLAIGSRVRAGDLEEEAGVGAENVMHDRLRQGIDLDVARASRDRWLTIAQEPCRWCAENVEQARFRHCWFERKDFKRVPACFF